MNSLVAADYGSNSSSDECASDDEVTINTKISTNNEKNLLKSASDSDNDSDDNNSSGLDEQHKPNETKKTILPSASLILLNGNDSSGQVFNNPYKKAEIAQIASLEKHVKMVDTDAHIQMKNGKKICWNYRKGRCRFGSNCSYAHDSDLHIAKDASGAQMEQQLNATDGGASANHKSTKALTTTKKRPGLSDSIIPSKKVIKAYNNSFKK